MVGASVLACLLCDPRDHTEHRPRTRACCVEARRVLRWLEDIERELRRISEQDEWDDMNIPRLVFDTSALVREGEFDKLNWSGITGGASVSG